LLVTSLRKYFFEFEVSLLDLMLEVSKYLSFECDSWENPAENETSTRFFFCEERSVKGSSEFTEFWVFGAS